METFHALRWRSAAKYVAIMDLVLCCLAIVMFLVEFTFRVDLEVGVLRRKLVIFQENSDDFQNLGLMIIQLEGCVALCYYKVLVLVELYAAARLLTATKLEIGAPKAFGNCVIWIVLTLCFIVLGLFFHCAIGFIWIWITETFLRLAGVYLVLNYTKELNRVTKATETIVVIFSSNALRNC